MLFKHKNNGGESAFPFLSPPLLGGELPVLQLHFVEPDGVISCCSVQVRLEGDVDLARARGAWGVSAVKVMFGAVDGDCDESSLAGRGAIEFQGQVVPSVGLGRRTANTGRPPSVIVRIVNLPSMRTLDVTFGTKDELLTVARLVNVELKGLRSRRILEVEIKIVDEVRSAGVRAELLPPKSVRVLVAATNGELSRVAVEGRRRNPWCRGMGRGRAGASCAGAGGTALPSRFLIEVAECGLCQRHSAHESEPSDD